MLKINSLLFTVALSFFSLFLFKTESSLAYKPANHSHDIKIDHSINTSAISTNNSLVEFLSFDKLKKQNQINYLESFKPLNKVLFENNSRYLKICDFLELNLTIHKIIFPFHSFL
ncbi:MAG: hypothetical protein GW827_08610 [Flavobacteriales bacterium]|nr:hypothetical protein [Flavobacteriia bacterium]NCP05818.1 hypothetical protein [Flavobacteriales bacterium]PIV94379.1 MAG: hypothetical protein COW44_04550 [Flavobacteriaceae bacterium CG17_big_fil_post_rev_8_21_14_2_50_33_15]PIY09202.1 MAG: hypothetical protein COZ17_13875 [Flavobacteriaceae bacterium CG_4_10_14_3_um_filter_33_47]PJB19495.1 MAG: hypothetical protein CO117_04580 [Flavobacteriaceae bacterium CG_4_9_14_3_um_filter_33_16]